MDQDICEGGHRLESGGRKQEPGVVDRATKHCLLPAVMDVAASVGGQGPQIVGSRSA